MSPMRPVRVSVSPSRSGRRYSNSCSPWTRVMKFRPSSRNVFMPPALGCVMHWVGCVRGRGGVRQPPRERGEVLGVDGGGAGGELAADQVFRRRHGEGNLASDLISVGRPTPILVWPAGSAPVKDSAPTGRAAGERAGTLLRAIDSARRGPVAGRGDDRVSPPYAAPRRS